MSQVVSLQGPAGPAKARLVASLVSWLAAQGLRVAAVHLSPEVAEGDAGKDTWKFRQAGANPVVLAAPGLCQITYVIPENQDFALKQALAVLAPNADLILIDAPGTEAIIKVSLTAAEAIAPFSAVEEMIALVAPAPQETATPVFHPDHIPELGRHILKCRQEGPV